MRVFALPSATAATSVKQFVNTARALFCHHGVSVLFLVLERVCFAVTNS
jgi:hypothetical protein